MSAKNGNEVLDEILKRAQEVQLKPVVPAGLPEATPDESAEDEDPTKIASELMEASRQLGDGKSAEPGAHKPKEEPVGQMGEQKTNPVSEANKGPEVLGNIKTAVFAMIEPPTEKVAASTRAVATNALKVAIPMFGLGAGYVAGRLHGDKIDRSNNKAYYQAGIFDTARSLARQIEAQKQGDGKR